MATAIGYIRVSTEGQAQDGVNLDAQRAKIEAWCALNGWTKSRRNIPKSAIAGNRGVMT